MTKALVRSQLMPCGPSASAACAGAVPSRHGVSQNKKHQHMTPINKCCALQLLPCVTYGPWQVACPLPQSAVPVAAKMYL
jgi:hypothetical protein